MSESEAPIEVRQSATSAQRYEATVCGRNINMTFLSAGKGRMDFTVDFDDKPLGKFNLLSQHSISRLSKAVGIPDSEKDDFKTAMLQVGICLRDGNFIPAPVADKIEREASEYEGLPSTFGVIESDTMNLFLQQPNLLDRINEILHQSRPTPFVGDDANLLLTFLVFMSCKTDNPLNLEMIGASSSGKTYMTLTARNGMPKSMVMVLAGASKEALKYDYDEVSDEGHFIVNVHNRCIVILEKDESFSFIKRMKPLMSGDDDELVWKTPIKNELTGEIETRDFIIRGRPSFITLTTRNPSEAEQITRQLLMTPETTPDKVEAVVSNSLLAKARPELLQIHPDLKLLQASMLNLKQHKVRNIFAPLMAEFFPSRNAQHQRDIHKVLSIIDAVALIHQQQRPIQTIGEDEYLLASVEDNVIGLLLCDLVLRASLSGVPDDSWMVFRQMQEMEASTRSLSEDNILQWLHIHAFSVSKNALQQKHLPTLEDAGLIEVKRRGGGRGGGRKTWAIVKTRTGLMETHALAPLFVESARRAIPDLMKEFSDVLETSNPPQARIRPNKQDPKLLQRIGCPSKAQAPIWSGLILPHYLTEGRESSMIYDIVGETKFRDDLFNTRCGWLNKGQDSATAELQKKREVREKVKEAVRTFSLDSEDDDAWESLANAHLSHLDDGDSFDKGGE